MDHNYGVSTNITSRTAEAEGRPGVVSLPHKAPATLKSRVKNQGRTRLVTVGRQLQKKEHKKQKEILGPQSRKATADVETLGAAAGVKPFVTFVADLFLDVKPSSTGTAVSNASSA